MTTIAARNLTVGALALDDLKVANRVLPGSSDTILTSDNRISDIQENPQLLGYINADQVVLILDSVVQTKSQSLNIMSPVVSGSDPTFNSTTDTNGGAGNAGYLVVLDGSGNLDGRDVGADGATLDGHVGSSSNPHSTSFGNLTDTDLTGFAQGSILYYNGTNWVQLSPGTNGQILQTQGAGANPQWFTSTSTDELVGISANDTTPGFLLNKLITATTGVAFTEVNDGGDEDLRLDIATASLTGQGLIELATQVEVDAGSDALRAVTPSTLASASTVVKPGDSAGGDLTGTYPNPSVNGLLTDELVGVTGADTTPGYLNDKISVLNAGASWAVLNPGANETYALSLPASSSTTQGLIELATQVEVDAGTDTTRAVTPDTLASATTVLKPGESAGGDLSGSLPNPSVVDLTITSEQQGSILYYNGTNWVQLSPGTIGQLLQTQGAGANPQWFTQPADTDELVGVSANDTTPGYLLGKLTTATTGVSWTEVNDGGDEDLRLDISTASDTTQGLIELATQAEVDAGTDALRAVTPDTLEAASTVVHPTDSIDVLADVDTTTATPTAGDSLEWDGSNWVPSTPQGYIVFPIWAEENGALSNTNGQWSFGNGSVGNIGIPVGLDCDLFAVTFNYETGPGTSVTIDVFQNGSQTYTSSFGAGFDQVDTLVSPISFSAGDRIGFQTNTVTGTFTDARVCAWFRVRASPASTSVLNDLLDVSLSGTAQGDILYNNGTSWTQLSAGTAGNVLTTQGGGSDPTWSDQSLYDAIVDASGNGDYLLPSAAFNAGAVSVFVRPGTYVETGDIILPASARFDGETAGGCVIVLSGGHQVIFDGSGRQETTGTISVATNSTAVTGTGTTFTNLLAGDYILLGQTFYEIASITNDTSLVLDQAYDGEALSGMAFVGQSMVNAARIKALAFVGATSGGALSITQARLVVVEGVLVTQCTGPGMVVTDSEAVLLANFLASHNTGDGLVFNNSFECSVRSSRLSNNNGNGIQIENGCIAILMDNVTTGHNTGEGINVTGNSLRTTITDGVLVYNSGKGINTDFGSDSCVIDSCLVQFNGGDGIDFDGLNNTVASCIVTNNGANGVQAGVGGVINGNHIAENTENGINLSGDADCSIVGNLVHDNTGDGIAGTSGNNNIIVGNRVYDNLGGEGIQVLGGSTGTVIDGNIVTGHTTNISDAGTSTLRGLAHTGAPVQGDITYYNGTNWTLLAPGTSGQLLQTNGAGANPTWVDGANIAQYRQSSNLTINTTATTVALNATDLEDSAFSRSGSDITINTAGVYRISYTVYFDTTANARRTIDAWVENNTTEIVPSRSGDYARNSTDDTGSAGATFLTPLAASDVIRLRCQSTGSNGTCLGIGNRMWITLELVRAT